MNGRHSLSDVGGTSGGLGEFLVGLGLAITGGYLFISRVMVMSSPWTLFGFDSFGLSLLPLLLGIGLLFFNGKSLWGWLLTFAGVLIIFAGILMNLRIFFQPTSLFHTLLMLAMLASGLGLIARSLRPHGS